MAKVAFIGAGSAVFIKSLLVDILSFPELAEITVSLHDIDQDRLRLSETVARKVAQAVEAHPTIETTLDRRKALEGADYAVCMIQVGGYKPATVTDFEIPRRYGLHQTIGDTLGIGGIMRALRTIPVLLDMCHDMEALCPDVTFLNYANPMAMNCWAINRASEINTVGLCHSVQNTAWELARDIGVPLEEINYLCAGINHMAFYLRFEHMTEDGGSVSREDLYPRIRQVIEEGRVPENDRVRYEVFRRLGYFVTESSEHFAEYVPWFIKQDRPDLIERFNIPLEEYMRRSEAWITSWDIMEELFEDPEFSFGDDVPPDKARALKEAWEETVVDVRPEDTLKIARSGEFAPLIIHSMETDTARVVYGNVPNHGLIGNLPQDCIVEVPCVVDRNGVQPTQIGTLPPQLAALMRTNINVQALTVEAALTQRREHIYHAAMLDPHTAAELSLEEIWDLVDDLIEAHADWLPTYH